MNFDSIKYVQRLNVNYIKLFYVNTELMKADSDERM